MSRCPCPAIPARPPPSHEQNLPLMLYAREASCSHTHCESAHFHASCAVSYFLILHQIRTFAMLLRNILSLLLQGAQSQAALQSSANHRRRHEFLCHGSTRSALGACWAKRLRNTGHLCAECQSQSLMYYTRWMLGAHASKGGGKRTARVTVQSSRQEGVFLTYPRMHCPPICLYPK